MYSHLKTLDWVGIAWTESWVEVRKKTRKRSNVYSVQEAMSQKISSRHWSLYWWMPLRFWWLLELLKITRKGQNLHVKAFFLEKLGKPWKPSEMKEQGLQVRSSLLSRDTYLSRLWQLKTNDPDLYVELINKNLIVYHLFTVWWKSLSYLYLFLDQSLVFPCNFRLAIEPSSFYFSIPL